MKCLLFISIVVLINEVKSERHGGSFYGLPGRYGDRPIFGNGFGPGLGGSGFRSNFGRGPSLFSGNLFNRYGRNPRPNYSGRPLSYGGYIGPYNQPRAPVRPLTQLLSALPLRQPISYFQPLSRVPDYTSPALAQLYHESLFTTPQTLPLLPLPAPPSLINPYTARLPKLPKRQYLRFPVLPDPPIPRLNVFGKSLYPSQTGLLRYKDFPKTKTENEQVEYYTFSHYNNDDEDDDDEDDSDFDEDAIDDEVDAFDSVIEAQDRRDDGISTINFLHPVQTNGQQLMDHSKFLKENKAEYETEKKARQGYKVTKGHESKKEFDKKSEHSHDENQLSQQYEKEGKNSEVYDNKVKDHGAHDVESEGIKSAKFDESKKHRKGSKTKGYHNVFHKDEYVKDHTFYDDLDHKGHYKKHDKEHIVHGKHKNKQKKGRHQKLLYSKGKQGKKGKYSQGNSKSADSLHEKKKGYDQHFKNNKSYKMNESDGKHLEYHYQKHS